MPVEIFNEIIEKKWDWRLSSHLRICSKIRLVYFNLFPSTFLNTNYK